MNKSTEINKTSKEVLLKELSTGAKTFAELMRLDGWKGDRCLLSSYCKNIILWDGISMDAIDIIHELKEKNIIKHVQSTFFLHLMDGSVTHLPTFHLSSDPENVKNLKTPHWLPTALALVEERT